MSVITVLEKLAPHVEREVNLILGSGQEAETLRYKLERIQEGLQEAERQGITNTSVKSWLKRLEDVMYEMDDALDKWEIKNLESQIEQSDYDDLSHPWEKVSSLFLCLCSRFKRVVGRRGLTLEMKALSARLDEVLKERNLYDFVQHKSDNSRELKKPETTSPVDESERYIGRESEVESLVGWLLSEGEPNGIRILSIVGVGGLGKTTLARLIFKDPRVEKVLKAWVSVPDPFDALYVAQAILKDFVEGASTQGTLENLGRRIKAAVPERNFFVVLDDVWTVDPPEWDSLKNFLVSEPGCRILVTTRDEKAARIMGTHWRRLNPLSDTDCAEILNGIALRGRSEEFRRIGSEIAKKCSGLPQAAKNIGSMLESKDTVENWVDVLESPLWKYEEGMSDVSRALRLSYMDLSPVLRRCFLSCALYSKGSWLYADELNRIWVAQGYISSSATWDQVQSKGIEYVQILFRRSFFQELEIGVDYMRCKVHDVVHEFASYLSRSEYYFILDRRTHRMPIDIDPRTRSFGAISVSPERLIPNFLRLVKRVRVLCLRNCGLEELSEEVGELIHLRYLDLSRNHIIKKLPETVCNLYNLQLLDLKWCDSLSRLPHGIGKLMKLRHLHTLGAELEGFPQGLQKLTNLWTLDQVIVTKDTVGCLRNLNQLKGRLLITVKGLKEAAEAEKANLRDKVHIQDLGISFSDGVTNDAVDALVPPPQLQSLHIDGKGNQQLPRWITTTSSLNNLKFLHISGFGDCSDFVPLGKLPVLEELMLWGMKFRRVTVEFLGGVISEGTSSTAMPVDRFPKLKKLRILHCGEWEEWEDLQEEEEAAAATADYYSVPLSTIPCLQELEIWDCPKLLALPHNLLRTASTLQKLRIRDSAGLESRYHEKHGADRDKISHILHIRIFGSKTDELDEMMWSDTDELEEMMRSV